MGDPTPCTRCGGSGRVYYYTRDDGRYLMKCKRCDGSGIEPRGAIDA